jgi:Transglutaminase-like superfamily/TgpA N-terminal domain
VSAAPATIESRKTLAIRQVAVSVFVAMCALGATRVFQRGELAWAVLLVAVPATVASLVRFRSLRWIAHLGVLAAAAVGASKLVGGTMDDAASGVLDGWSKLLSTTWPSPLRPELVAFVVVLIGLAAIVSAELAVATRWRAVLLIPGIILATGLMVLSAAAGPVSWGWFALAVLCAAIVLVVAVPGGPQLTVLSGETAPFVMAAAVLAVAIGSGSVIDRLERADPRSVPETNLDRSTEINPLSQVVAQRALDPAQPVMRVTGLPDTYLRLLALEEYDGVQWSLAPTFASVGRTLRSNDGVALGEVEIEPLGAPLSWIPVSGEAHTINRDVSADPERSMLFINPPLEPGSTVSVSVSSLQLDESRLRGAAALPPLRDEISGSLVASAVRLAGSEGGMYERLRALENTLKTTFQLDTEGSAGVNAGSMRLFVETTTQGTEEQFVAAFTLLARSLGARARIAVGYVAPPGVDVVTTAEASAWPEVWFEGVGWVPFDPTPEQTIVATPGAVAQVGPGASPIPPIAPPPPLAEPTASTDEVNDRSTGLGGRLLRALALVGGFFGVCVVVIGTVTGVVLLLKRRRRRRRLFARRRSDRVIGAWVEATATLVDYGATFQHDQTNLEVAESAVDIAGEAGRESLSDLAGLADEAAHGRDEPDDLTVAHAMRLLGQIEQTVAQGHRHSARWRAKVTLRSLSSAGRTLTE